MNNNLIPKAHFTLFLSLLEGETNYYSQSSFKSVAYNYNLYKESPNHQARYTYYKLTVTTYIGASKDLDMLTMMGVKKDAKHIIEKVPNLQLQYNGHYK